MPKRVYLCGPIANSNYETCALGWRKKVFDALSEFEVYSPMRGKAFLKAVGTITTENYGATHPLASDRGILGRDVTDVKSCDLMFANFIECPPKASIGSAAEYGLAYAWQKPIITVMEKGNVHDHPFIRGMSTYILETVDEGIAYARFLLAPGY